MEMNKKPEHINDIVGSEVLYHPTLRESVLRSKVGKAVVYTIGGIVLAGYIFLASSLAIDGRAEGSPPPSPFPGGKEPKGIHQGWGNGNEYGHLKDNNGKHGGWVVKEY